MNLIETQFLAKEKPPQCCSYCDEEKRFLMVKPVAFSHNGEMLINVNHTSKHLWICLDCFSMDLDSMGYGIDIHEYDE